METELPVLSLLERRVLGVLVEKAKTTPDVYPMSLNSLVAGCNQKSNRDPLMNLDDSQIEDVLEGLKPKGLVMKVIGGRVDRWRQQMYETLHVTKQELAILAELFLRGPQTEAELRTRADRMEPFPDLEALKAVVRPLVERKLVVYLGQEGRRGTQLTHGFHDPREIEAIRRGLPAEVAEAPPRAMPIPVMSVDHVAELRAELAALKTEVETLKADMATLKQSLGG